MGEDDGSTKEVSLEHWSLRWLSKAFAGYNVLGCLTDVANLVFAMRGKPPGKLDELEIVEAIEDVAQKVKEKDFSGLWVPTHMIHDAEVDDQLAWLLLRHIHKWRNSRLVVLVQMPREDREDAVLEDIISRKQAQDCQIFRDETSRNAKAIKLNYI